MTMSKIFYDGKCPVCKKEISLYKKLSMSNSIEWYNVHSNQAALKKVNKSKEECLKLLHVYDDNNNLYLGVEAFIFIWKKTKYFKYIAYCLDFKLIKIPLNFFYKLYAKKKYIKLYAEE